MICLAYAWEDDEEVTILEKDKADGFIRQLDYSNTIIVAHNCLFDGAVIRWHYGMEAENFLCTMAMAAGLRKTHYVSLRAMADYYTSQGRMVGIKGDEVANTDGKHYRDFDPVALEIFKRYCANDVILMRKIYDEMVKDGFPKQEERVINIFLNMYLNPTLVVDAEACEMIIADKEDAINAAMEREGVTRTELRSRLQFPEVVKEKFGVEIPVDPETGKLTFSKTNAALATWLNAQSYKLQKFFNLKWRASSAIAETRAKALIDNTDGGTRPLPVHLIYYGAHTGRASGGSGINMQNLPRPMFSDGEHGHIVVGDAVKRAVDARDDEVKTGHVLGLRDAIVAPDGHILVACDLSQIEARMNAWLWNEKSLVQLFADGEDVYKHHASRQFNKPVEQITKQERFIAKSAILALGYNSGVVGYKRTLKDKADDHPDSFYQSVVDTYRRVYPHITLGWRLCQDALMKMMRGGSGTIGEAVRMRFENNRVWLPNGLSLWYDNLRYDNAMDSMVYDIRKKTGKIEPVKIYGGKMDENIVQALARIVIMEQMAVLDMLLEQAHLKPHVHIALQVHDEIVLNVDTRKVDYRIIQSTLEKVMRTAPKWAKGLPINCESVVAKRYSNCK